MKGTGNMLGDEALTNADYASELNTIGRNAKGDWSAAQPGIAAAGKVDSGAMALGGLAQGLGTAISAAASVARLAVLRLRFDEFWLRRGIDGSRRFRKRGRRRVVFVQRHF